MRTVWKYSLMPGEQIIEVPGSGYPVGCGLDPQGHPCIWFIVHPKAETRETVKVHVYGTGQNDIETTDILDPVGSFVWAPGLMVHVFVSRAE